jgi:hypothetical protein
MSIEQSVTTGAARDAAAFTNGGSESLGASAFDVWRRACNFPGAVQTESIDT